MFLYAIKSEQTKVKYKRRLEMFFDFIGLNGTLVEKAKQIYSKRKG